MQLERQGLAQDVLAVFLDGLRQLWSGLDVQPDAVGDDEASLLAQILDAAHEPTRQALAQQRRRQLGLEGRQIRPLGSHHQPGAGFCAHLNFFR